MKHEDAALVQIQVVVGLLGGTVTSMMVDLASVRQKPQQAAAELGRPHLGHSTHPRGTRWPSLHTLRLCTKAIGYLFQLFIREGKKGAVSQFGGNKSELVEMFNREYLPYLDSLFKGDVESAVSKQHFDQLSQEKPQSLGHASQLDYNRATTAMFLS